MDIRSNQILDRQYALSRTKKLSISIGGISCAIISRDISFLDLLRAQYQWFESSGPTAYEILVSLVPLEEFPSGELPLPPYPLVKKVNSGDNYIITRSDAPFVAVVNTSSRKVLVKIGNNPYIFDIFLRVLFNLILTTERGLLLQASAAIEMGQGIVFFDPSGSHKTAVAQQSEGRTILTDKLVLIKPYNGGYRVYGTPFQGDFMLLRRHARVQLRGLYLLKKDQTNSLVPLDNVQAITELYKCVPYFSDDTYLLDQVSDTCRTLVDTVPVYELHFRPDSSLWQVMNEHRQEGNGSVQPGAGSL